MVVERGQRGPEHGQQVEGAELGCRRGLRQVLADMLPQIAIDDRIDAHEIVGNWHAGQLHNAALDRVHQAEIGHDPGEEITFGIARTAQKEERTPFDNAWSSASMPLIQSRAASSFSAASLCRRRSARPRRRRDFVPIAVVSLVESVTKVSLRFHRARDAARQSDTP